MTFSIIKLLTFYYWSNNLSLICVFHSYLWLPWDRTLICLQKNKPLNLIPYICASIVATMPSLTRLVIANLQSIVLISFRILFLSCLNFKGLKLYYFNYKISCKIKYRFGMELTLFFLNYVLWIWDCWTINVGMAISCLRFRL